MGEPVELRVVSCAVGWSADGVRLGAALRQLDPDLVCLHDLPPVLWWRGRCAALARRAGLLYAGGGGTGGGAALFGSIRVDVQKLHVDRETVAAWLVAGGWPVAFVAGTPAVLPDGPSWKRLTVPGGGSGVAVRGRVVIEGETSPDSTTLVARLTVLNDHVH